LPFPPDVNSMLAGKHECCIAIKTHTFFSSGCYRLRDEFEKKDARWSACLLNLLSCLLKKIATMTKSLPIVPYTGSSARPKVI